MAEAPFPDRQTRLAFPNAKVNLGLQVRQRRPDGFHNIESLFVPIGWKDTLELEVPTKGSQNTLNAHGLTIPGPRSHNLIFKAHDLLSQAWEIPPVCFHLIKAIPMGAGLGGGSSDGAFALHMLNEHFNLGLTVQRLESLAAQLGSDCPFFIRNTPAHVSGRGEHIQPLQLRLDGWWIMVLHPNVHVSTPQAFGWVSPNDQRPSLSNWENSTPGDWTTELQNDFTAPISERFPEVAKALKLLRSYGAAFTDMSGSGSAVFGCFSTEPDPSWSRALPEGWSAWMGPMAQ